MKDGRPSGTAVLVSLARAIATLDGAGPARGIDPLAQRMLPPPLRAAVSALERLVARDPRVIGAARGMLFGLVEHLELRTLTLDRVVRAALARGVPQLVVLGAGLDTRGFRLAEASRATVFEVDHPATQAYKVTRVPHARGDVRFVAVDFERDSLDARLEAAGHDATRATVWIWEGVTPYLAKEATLATLRVVAKRSVARSEIAVTYATPSMASVTASLRPLVHVVFAMIAEPLRGLVTREEMHSLLEATGFRVVDDSGVADWKRREHATRMPRFRIRERVAIAERVEKI